MKFLILLSTGLIISVFSYCQENPKIDLTSKNIIEYKADLILMQVATPDPMNEKVLASKNYGINVEIYLDTIFNKYVIVFTNDDNNRIVWPLKFLGSLIYSSNLAKAYKMEFNGSYFILNDSMEFIGVNTLTITFAEPLETRNILRYVIRNVKRITPYK